MNIMNKYNLLWIGVVILALAFIYYVFLHRNEKVSDLPLKNNIVVAFGDSLIEGVGASPNNDLVSVIERDLGIDVINKGKSGDTTASALTRIDEVISLEPGVVIILLGGNDFLRRVPKEETFNNLETIIKKFQDKQTAVILLGIRGGILSDGYKDSFIDLSKKYHTIYISDVLDNVITKKDLMSDGIHPNDKGYKIIADRITPVLRELLDK